MPTEHTDAEKAILSKRRRVRRQKNVPGTKFYPIWTHPSVLYWAPTWALIRDCILGEQQVKSKETIYLPALDEQTQEEYSNYLDRSVFYNMTGRTVQSLVGIVFQKRVKISGLPEKEKTVFRNPTRAGITLEAFLKSLTAEVVTTGRVGVLLDMDSQGKNVPYFTSYAAENILDWVETEIDGRLVPTEIVLREIREMPRSFNTARTCISDYRVLKLVQNSIGTWEYQQQVYKDVTDQQDLSNLEPTIVTPTRRGVPFDRIPFRFIGAIANTPDVDRSPIADIANLNLSHYKAYAQLEHGRFYTAMPIYYAITQNGQQSDYRIGSAVVWEVGVGEKPGVIEFNGQGLVFLENSCRQKEDQIAALGGRLLGGKARSVAESDNEVKLKEGNERAILLNVVMGINEAMTELGRLWLLWRDYDPATADELAVELNTQFLMDTVGARELRAMYAMYKDGVVPVTVLHYYLHQAEAIPDWMDVDEFKKLLDDEKEFPNQPDVMARMQGFSSNAEMLNDIIKKRQTKALERQTVVKEEEAQIERDLADNEIENGVPAKIPPVRPGTAK